MNRPLEILVLLSPLVEQASPSAMTGCYRDFIPRLQEALREAGRTWRMKLVMNEFLPGVIRKSELPVYGEFCTVSQRDILGGYRYNGLQELTRWQETRQDRPFLEGVRRAVAHAVGEDYQPDLIISFTPGDFIRLLYPAARYAQAECGPFSRAPYPTTMLFDPYGYGHNYYYSTHSAEINAQGVSEEARRALASYRAEIKAVLSSSKVLSDYFSDLRRRFAHIIVLALGGDRFHEADIGNSYQGQFEYAEHVLDSVGPDTAVVMTQHPHSPAINGHVIGMMKRRYPNLVSEDWFAAIGNFSQIAVAYADGAVTLSSTVGLQAAFLGGYFVSPTGYCSGIADCTCLERIPEMFNRPPLDRDPFFSWTLTHYSIPQEALPSAMKAVLEAPGDRPYDFPCFCPDAALGGLLDRYLAEFGTPYRAILSGLDELGLERAWESKDLWQQANSSQIRRDAIVDEYMRRGIEVQSLKCELERLRGSLSYRVGRLVTWPLRKLKYG